MHGAAGRLQRRGRLPYPLALAADHPNRAPHAGIRHRRRHARRRGPRRSRRAHVRSFGPRARTRHAPGRTEHHELESVQMSTVNDKLDSFLDRDYEAGFVTQIESETFPKGLDENVIRRLSAIKREPEFMREWRRRAYREWLKMALPRWAKVHYPDPDFQDISYYSAPKSKKDGPKSLDEVDPELLRTYEKLGVPLHERAKLAGVAVDAVFDSVSVATTFRKQLADVGIIFCSFSEAVRSHPELVQKYMGSV